MFNTLANTKIKTFKDSLSLEVQDSNLKVNGSGNDDTSALMKSKREISVKTNNSIKGNGLDRHCNQTKDTTPRIEVTVDFAAKQLFQILLVDIKRRNNKFDSILEPLPGAICV